ncbi:hypothetical protein [Massilia timonae]|uniref:hypothetical protein n=1 Tax=Massilia timonae TaxID=47229 RepID=UPI0028A0A0F8|nr:hypothetical protein [Massilia timonae]
MKKIEEKIAEGNFLFMTAVDMMPALIDIPLKELRENDIFVLQKISKAAFHDGIEISVGVDFDDKLLTALRIAPDFISNLESSRLEADHPTIYIANDISPIRAVRALQAISERYSRSSPPPYLDYHPNADASRFDQWTTAGVEERNKHDLFMRNHDMYHISIPPKYRKMD